MAKISLYLDSRRRSKDGTSPLKISVFHAGKTLFIATGMKFNPDEWDSNLNKPLTAVNDFKRASLWCEQARLVASDLAAKGTYFTTETLRDEIMKELFPRQLLERREREVVAYKRSPRVDLVGYMELFSEMKVSRTRDLYRATIKRILEFTGGKSPKFEDVDRTWLMRFDAWLTPNSPSANSRAIHMRNIRAVFNYAIDEEVTTAYPFRRFKIKHAKTRKRALPIETLRRILTMPLPEWVEVYRDMFALSFYLIGINIIDLCSLKEIRNGYIQYVRAKTHRPYAIKVEPEALEIIKKYKGKNQLLFMLDGHKNYRIWYNQLRNGLEAVKAELNKEGIEIQELTTYWARHSWATIARSIGVSVDDIALALGHGDGHDLTHIYIQDETELIDKANRRVIDYVLYGKL